MSKAKNELKDEQADELPPLELTSEVTRAIERIKEALEPFEIEKRMQMLHEAVRGTDLWVVRIAAIPRRHRHLFADDGELAPPRKSNRVKR